MSIKKSIAHKNIATYRNVRHWQSWYKKALWYMLHI